MSLQRIRSAPWPLLVALAVLTGACSGGGGNDTEPGAPVLAVVQPVPEPSGPSPVVGETAPVTVTGAAIRYHGVRQADRTTVGRREAPLLGMATAAGAPVDSQGLPAIDVIEDVSDFIENRRDDFLESTLPDSIVDDILGIDDDNDDLSIRDYYPTGAKDEWTFVGDAAILQGTDPKLLFGLDGAAPATYGFTLVVHDSGFYFSHQEVTGGVITATPPLLWLPNGLRPEVPHRHAADLTYTPDTGEPVTRHVERTVTLVERGPHVTLHSYFADALHFRIEDQVSPVPADGNNDTLTYDLYLGRRFGPVQCDATDGVSPLRHAEIERAVIRGQPRPDTDGDGLVDADDPDDDNDGTPDDHFGGNTPGALVDWDQRCRSNVAGCNDAFPKDPAEQADNDGDHTGNHADPDDDADAVPDLVDYYPWDASHSEGPYRVYLWTTDPVGVRHLYALDPAGVTPPEEIVPETPGELWGLAVYPRRAGGPVDPRVAILAPATGANPADPDGSHLWVKDAEGLRDVTPSLTFRVTRATWEVDGESLFLGLWTSKDHSNQAFRQVDRAGLDPLTRPLEGEVWKYRFSPDQRYLAYADESHVFSELHLRDRFRGDRNLTPEEEGEILLGIVRKSFSVFELDRDPEFSADGSRLATAGALSMIERWYLFFHVYDRGPEEKICVWETATDHLVRRLSADDFGVGRLKFQLPPSFAALSPFGRYLAVEVYPGEDERLDLLDLETGTISTLSDRLPPPVSHGAHWERGAGGWAFTDPPALVLPLVNADGVTLPTRLPVDGSGPVELIGADHASEGPILLSPHGRTVFFVHDHAVWRVDTGAADTPVAITAPFADPVLRLEVAR
jgi:hypothetical protein